MKDIALSIIVLATAVVILGLCVLRHGELTRTDRRPLDESEWLMGLSTNLFSTLINHK